jgi:hypothetical protein
VIYDESQGRASTYKLADSSENETPIYIHHPGDNGFHYSRLLPSAEGDKDAHESTIPNTTLSSINKQTYEDLIDELVEENSRSS